MQKNDNLVVDTNSVFNYLFDLTLNMEQYQTFAQEQYYNYVLEI